MRLILSIVILLASATIHAEEQVTDFRKATWGMTKEQVRDVEKKAEFAAENEDALMYKGTLAGFDVSILYRFVSGQLVRGMYFTDITHSNKNNYVSDYIKLKELLAKKYGLPATSKIYWRNDLYKDKPQKWGFAISLGHLQYYAIWVTESTKIELSLAGDNHEILLGISYDSIDLELLRKESEDKKALDDL